MSPWYLKKISAWITYPLLVIFSVVTVGASAYFYVPRKLMAQGYLQGFEGILVDVDYVSCVCSLALLMTIEPTVTAAQGGAAHTQYLFYYAPQILEQLGIKWEIGGLPIPIPRMYLVAPYVAYEQQTLGNFVPGGFPCVAYSGNSCTINGYYPAIVNIGAAPYPRTF